MKSHKITIAAGTLAEDQRREHRQPGGGTVVLYITSPSAVEIHGELINLSLSGFRVAHQYTAMAAGQAVDFTHDQGAGRARVVWSRILEGNIESGFVIIP